MASGYGFLIVYLFCAVCYIQINSVSTFFYFLSILTSVMDLSLANAKSQLIA